VDGATLLVAVVASRTEAELSVGMLRSHGLRAAVAADDAGGQEAQLHLQGVRVRGRPADDRGPPAVPTRRGTSSLCIPPGGLVSDFFAAGLVSAAVNQHYGSEMAVQIEYAPFGKPTGLCSALATTAYQNEGLTLQPCGTPGTTVWIVDTADSPATAPARFPIVNGSTTNFTHPFAMIIHGNPAHKRFPQIKVQHLRGNPAHVRVSQLWGANILN
jgi:hypothetical protein